MFEVGSKFKVAMGSEYANCTVTDIQRMRDFTGKLIKLYTVDLVDYGFKKTYTYDELARSALFAEDPEPLFEAGQQFLYYGHLVTIVGAAKVKTVTGSTYYVYPCVDNHGEIMYISESAMVEAAKFF